jgi:hypothetical protein
MIPARREQFGEGCEFGEVKPRMGDRGQGVTFLVKVNKDAEWYRQEAKTNGRESTVRKEGEGRTGSTGPTRMPTWEAHEATGQPVEPKRQDTEWGREVVYLLRLHPVGVAEGPMTRARTFWSPCGRCNEVVGGLRRLLVTSRTSSWVVPPPKWSSTGAG